MRGFGDILRFSVDLTFSTVVHLFWLLLSPPSRSDVLEGQQLFIFFRLQSSFEHSIIFDGTQKASVPIPFNISTHSSHLTYSCNCCLFPVSVNSEVSNEVDVTTGVLIIALRAAPVGPYTNYLKWFQLLIRWSYKIIG